MSDCMLHMVWSMLTDRVGRKIVGWGRSVKCGRMYRVAQY